MNDYDNKKMEIIYSQNFSMDERSEISKAFSEIVPVDEKTFVRLSAELLPAVLTFSLGFIFGATATGFFRALGSDLYNKTKQTLIKILKNKREPLLVFEMMYNEIKIKIESRTKDELELNKVFDTIDKAKDLAIKELDKKDIPKMTDIVLFFDEEWKLHSGQHWDPPTNIAFYSYNQEKNIWELANTWGIKNGKPFRIEKE